MTIDRPIEYLQGLLRELRALPKETGWVELKENVRTNNLEEIGEYISALSNSAMLCGKSHAYLVWGIDNETHKITGTAFRPNHTKKGNKELESWLFRLLNPKIHFSFDELEVENKNIVLLEIKRASHHPVSFKGQEYIRVGS